jgi:hypothetical protein
MWLPLPPQSKKLRWAAEEERIGKGGVGEGGAA